MSSNGVQMPMSRQIQKTVAYERINNYQLTESMALGSKYISSVVTMFVAPYVLQCLERCRRTSFGTSRTNPLKMKGTNNPKNSSSLPNYPTFCISPPKRYANWLHSIQNWMAARRACSHSVGLVLRCECASMKLEHRSCEMISIIFFWSQLRALAKQCTRPQQTFTPRCSIAYHVDMSSGEELSMRLFMYSDHMRSLSFWQPSSLHTNSMLYWGCAPIHYYCEY